MERRLAAVLIADVVGYVRLSQADEEGTRTRGGQRLAMVHRSEASPRGELSCLRKSRLAAKRPLFVRLQ
jgi:class 3 adenylate cyclase